MLESNRILVFILVEIELDFGYAHTHNILHLNELILAHFFIRLERCAGNFDFLPANLWTILPLLYTLDQLNIC